MADATQNLPTYFNGRFPGAPIPAVPPPVVPNFVPRFAQGLGGITNGALPQFPTAPIPADGTPSVLGVPLAATPLANTDRMLGAPVAPTAGTTTAATSNIPPLPPLLPDGTTAPSITGGVTNALQPRGPATVGLPTLADPNNSIQNVNGVEIIRGDPNGGSAFPNATGGLPVGANGLQDPSAAINNGFAQQTAYRDQGLQAIQAAAQVGDPRNYSFRLSHLVGALGNNNFGAVQGQGVDALNQSLAGITSAGTYAGASMYGADTGLAENAARIGEQGAEFAQTPREAGVDTTYSPLGLPQGGHTVFALPGGMVGGRAAAPTPIGTPSPRQPLIDGQTGTTKDGQRVVVRNGAWVAAQ